MIFQNCLFGTRIPDLIDHINESSKTDKVVRERDATTTENSKNCAVNQINTIFFPIIAGNEVIVKKQQKGKT